MDRIMEELCEEAFQKGFEQGYEQEIDKVRIQGIKSIMKNFQYTALQAMDALGIPTEEQPKYLSMLADETPHADSKT